MLTGAGQGFCAGADLTEFKGLQDPQAAEERAELTMQLHLAFSKISTPIVTAINGAAMGGGAGLAIAGDIAVMAAGAKLGYPEAKHGIVAAIVMANLVRQVGTQGGVRAGRARRADRRRARARARHGEPRGRRSRNLMPQALAYRARSSRRWLRPAMAQTKRLFHEVADLPLAAALERGRDANRRMRNFQKLDEAK